MSKHKSLYDCIWTIRHYRDGKMIWEDDGPNSLTQQGEESILETYFKNGEGYVPAQFYVRLCYYSPLVTDTLNSILYEPTTNGYAPQLVERTSLGFPTKDIDNSGAYRVMSKVISFTASGGSIGPITNAFLSTTSDNSGILVAFRALAMTRTILDGDTMTLQFRVKLS